MHHFFISIVFVIMLVKVSLARSDPTNDQIVKIVTDVRYPIETHQVETEDGYILTMFRIPHGKNTNTTNDEPVMVTHGLFGSSENFIMLGPNEALGYILADRGYDVWIPNVRGTWHSKKHKTLKPDQKEFWNFSWHEIGIYDIPSLIDYILNVTNKRSLFYIGHSQGGTIAVVMGSEKPEYNQKIKLMIGIGPAVYMKNTRELLYKSLAINIKLLSRLADTLKVYELPPPFFSSEDIRKLAKTMCVDHAFLHKTCVSFLSEWIGVNLNTLNKTAAPFMLSLLPGSASFKQTEHFAQLITSGYFQKFDWGPETNLEKYGTKHPPLYNLKNVTYPIMIIFSDGDIVITPKDIELLAKDLPNTIGTYKVPSNGFTHIDYITSNVVKNLVYKKIIDVLAKYKNK